MTVPLLPALVPSDPNFQANVDDFFATRLPDLTVALNAELERINSLGFGSYSATSTTSNSVTTGAKTFVIETGKSFVAGQAVLIARTSDPTSTYMVAQVVSYNAMTGSLVVSVSFVFGTGTFTDWTIGVTAIFNATPASAGQVPPTGWTNVRPYLTAGTFSFTVPENVFQLGLYLNGGGGLAGGGGGFAYGVLDVTPGQVIPNMVVGEIGGTTSIAGLLSATGGNAGVGGSGSIISAALRLTEVFSGSASGFAGSRYGNGGVAIAPFMGQSNPFESDFLALVNKRLAGAPPGNISFSVNGAVAQDTVVNIKGFPGGQGQPGGTASRGTGISGTFIGGDGGILGAGGSGNSGVGRGGFGAPGSPSGNGGSNQVGAILVYWTPGY